MVKFDDELLIKLFAEFLASFIVQFVGCATPPLLTLRTVHSQDPEFIGPDIQSRRRSVSVRPPVIPADPVMYSMVWGGSVLAATQTFRFISGAHINPCVSVAAIIVKNVKILEGLLYILMQLLGSASGFGVSLALFQNQRNMEKYFCLTVVTVTPWWKSLFIEFFLTGAWVIAMCASWHEANQTMMESISLRIGVIVVACTMAGSVFTGSSMNPFRTIWSIILAGYYKHCYVYIVMPLAAGVLIGLAWRFIYNMGGKGAAVDG